MSPIVGALKARWKAIAIWTVVFAGLGAAKVFIARPMYSARAALLLAAPDSNVMSRTQALAAAAGSASASPLSLLSGILASENARTRIGDAVGMTPIAVKGALETKEDIRANQLEISSTMKSPELAVQMVSTAIQTLEDLNRTVGFSTAQRQVIYLKSAVAQREKELKIAQQGLAEYQKQMSVAFDPEKPGTATEFLRQLKSAELELGIIDSQITSLKSTAVQSSKSPPELPNSVPTANAFRNRWVEDQYALNVARTKFGPANREVVRLKRLVDQDREALLGEVARYVKSVDLKIDPKLTDLISRRTVAQWQIEYLRPLVASAPTEVSEFSTRYRNVKLLSGTVDTLREQYERARVDAEVDKVRWTVLDKPLTPTLPSNKDYKRTVIVAAVFGLLFGIVAAITAYRRSLS